MVSKDSFFCDERGAYIVSKVTEKTILFTPVKSVYVGYGSVSNFALYDSVHRATKEPDTSRKPIRFKLCNDFRKSGLATFYETKKGVTVGMFEMKDDTFTIEHNYG